MGNLGINDPVLLRKRRRPACYETGSEGYFSETVEMHYRKIYYEYLDLLIEEIKSRFDQPGYKQYALLQEFLLGICKPDKDLSEIVGQICEFYGDDLRKHKLLEEIQTFQANVPPNLINATRIGDNQFPEVDV